jgi:WD40 repeat protein
MTVRVHPPEKQVMGHKYGVIQVAVTPDGRNIASISYQDRTLLIWDAESGKPLHDIAVTYGYEKIRGLGISPDGRYLIVSGEGQSKILDFQTGQWGSFPAEDKGAIEFSADSRFAIVGGSHLALVPLDGEFIPQPFFEEDDLESWFGHVAITPDGSLAISTASHTFAKSDTKGTITVWDLSTRKAIYSHRYTVGVGAILVTPDGRNLLACRGGDTAVTLVNWETGEALERIESGHRSAVYCIAFTPDGRHLVTGSKDGSLIIKDWQTREIRHRCVGHGDTVKDIAITGDSQRIISGSADCTVRQWDVETGRSIQRGVPQNSIVSFLILSPDERFACAPYERDNGQVALWNLQTGDLHYMLKGHEGTVNAINFVPGTPYLISASDDGTLRLWDWQTRQHVHTIRAHEGQIYAVRATEDGKRAISIGRDGLIKTWDLRIGQPAGADIRFEPNSIHHQAVIAPNGRYATAATDLPNSTSINYRVWDLQDGREIAAVVAHDVAISRDSRHAIFVVSPNLLEVWDLEARARKHRLQIYVAEMGIGRVALTTSDRLMATTSYQPDQVQVWDIESGSRLLVAPAEETGHYGLAITPDNRRVITGGFGTLRMWDIASGQEIATAPIEADFVSLIPTRSGSTILVRDSDGALRCFDFADL